MSQRVFALSWLVSLVACGGGAPAPAAPAPVPVPDAPVGTPLPGEPAEPALDLFPIGRAGGPSLYVDDERIGPLVAGTLHNPDTLRGLFPPRYHVLEDSDHLGNYRIEVGLGTQDDLATLFPASDAIRLGMVWITSNRILAPDKPWTVEEELTDTAGMETCECLEHRPVCYAPDEAFAFVIDAGCGDGPLAPDEYLGRMVHAIAWSPSGWPLPAEE